MVRNLHAGDTVLSLIPEDPHALGQVSVYTLTTEAHTLQGPCSTREAGTVRSPHIATKRTPALIF